MYSETDFIPLVQRPEDFMIVVAGGAGKHTLFCPTYAIRSHAITKEVQE